MINDYGIFFIPYCQYSIKSDVVGTAKREVVSRYHCVGAEDREKCAVLA